MATLNGPQRTPEAGEPDSVVLLLHGVGSAGDRMIGLADQLAAALPRTRFYAPNAPNPYDPGRDPKNVKGASDDATGRYQWYDRFSERTRQEGLYSVAKPLNAFIAECLRENDLDESRCGVIGFSQGAITGLSVMPRRSTPLAAFIPHSGYLFSPDSLAQRTKQRERFFAEVVSRTPTCAIHGLDDTTLPWQTLQEAALTYDEADIPTELHLIGGLGHATNDRTVSIMGAFLQRQLKLDFRGN